MDGDFGRGGRLQSAKLRMRPGPWSSKKWRWPFLGLVVLQSLTNMLFFIMPTQLPFLASEFPGASKHKRKEPTMKIVTSLSFKGQCREAFEFYAKVLGGKITAAMPYGDAPPGMPITDEKYKTWLMHCWLDVGDQALMGADMDAGWAPNIDKPKNGFDVTLHTEDKAEAQRWFDQLSDGGKAVMPFGETFWSPGFGSLIDRFGVPWMVNVIPSVDWRPSLG